MADKIQLKRGLKQDLPTLDNGEVGYVQDTEELYIGSTGGNKKLTFDADKYASYDAQLAENATVCVATGDPTTDTNNIIALMLVTKSKLKLSGNFTIKNTVVVKSNIEIELAEGSTITNDNTLTGNVFDLSGVTNVKIKRLNFLANTTKPNTVIRVRNGCTYVYLDDCLIDGSTYAGVYVNQNSQYVFINRGKSINSAGNGYELVGSNIYVDKVLTTDNTKNGVLFYSLKATPSINNQIKNSICSNNKRFGVEFDGELDTSTGRVYAPQQIWVENDTCNGNGNAGLYSGIQVNGVIQGWIINNFVFSNQEHGITLMDCQDIFTSKNIARKNGACGIRLQGEYTKSSYGNTWRGVKKCKIVSNTCQENGQNYGSLGLNNHQKSGIYLDYNCNDNDIELNNLDANIGYGVSISHTAGYADCLTNILRNNKYLSNGVGKYFIDSYNVKYNTIAEDREQKQATIDGTGNLVLGVGDFFFIPTSATNIIGVHADDTYVGRIITLRFTGGVRLIRSGTFRINGDISATTNMTITLLSDGIGWWEVSRSHVNADSTTNRPIGITVGCMYYDTTLKKPIWWDGAVWKDSTGTTV